MSNASLASSSGRDADHQRAGNKRQDHQFLVLHEDTIRLPDELKAAADASHGHSSGSDDYRQISLSRRFVAHDANHSVDERSACERRDAENQRHGISRPRRRAQPGNHHDAVPEWTALETPAFFLQLADE